MHPPLTVSIENGTAKFPVTALGHFSGSGVVALNGSAVPSPSRSSSLTRSKFRIVVTISATEKPNLQSTAANKDQRVDLQTPTFRQAPRFCIGSGTALFVLCSRRREGIWNPLPCSRKKVGVWNPRAIERHISSDRAEKFARLVIPFNINFGYTSMGWFDGWVSTLGSHRIAFCFPLSPLPHPGLNCVPLSHRPRKHSTGRNVFGIRRLAWQRNCMLGI